MDDMKRPEGLSELGNKAYDAIMAFLEDHDMKYTGGCKAFRSPQEWEEREEEFGTDSELLVVHDGGDLSHIFNLDKADPELYQKIQAALDKQGVFAEQCTSWYTAIYSNPTLP